MIRLEFQNHQLLEPGAKWERIVVGSVVIQGEQQQDAAEVLVSANPSFRGQIHTFPVSRFASISSSLQNDPV